MIPDFPSIRKELDDAIELNLRKSARSKSVVATLVRGVTQHEGKVHSFHQEGTGTVQSGYTAMEAISTVNFEEVPNLIGDRLSQKLDEISSSMAKQMSAQFYSTMDEITEKTGNRVDSGGGPLTKELALEVLRMSMWSPDSVFITHPVMAESMVKSWAEWQTDREFMKEYEQVSSIKREEWRARESDRKLVSQCHRAPISNSILSTHLRGRRDCHLRIVPRPTRIRNRCSVLGLTGHAEGLPT